MSDITPEELVKQFTTIIGGETIKLFYALGLKTHIETMLKNEATGEEFVFSFCKVGDGSMIPRNVQMALDNKRLKEENDHYRKALAWYANSDNYLADDYTLATAWGMNKNIEKKATEALKQK